MTRLFLLMFCGFYALSAGAQTTTTLETRYNHKTGMQETYLKTKKIEPSRPSGSNGSTPGKTTSSNVVTAESVINEWVRKAAYKEQEKRNNEAIIARNRLIWQLEKTYRSQLDSLYYYMRRNGINTMVSNHTQILNLAVRAGIPSGDAVTIFEGDLRYVDKENTLSSAFTEIAKKWESTVGEQLRAERHQQFLVSEKKLAEEKKRFEETRETIVLANYDKMWEVVYHVGGDKMSRAYLDSIYHYGSRAGISANDLMVLFPNYNYHTDYRFNNEYYNYITRRTKEVIARLFSRNSTALWKMNESLTERKISNSRIWDDSLVNTAFRFGINHVDMDSIQHLFWKMGYCKQLFYKLLFKNQSVETVSDQQIQEFAVEAYKRTLYTNHLYEENFSVSILLKNFSIDGRDYEHLPSEGKARLEKVMKAYEGQRKREWDSLQTYLQNNFDEALRKLAKKVKRAKIGFTISAVNKIIEICLENKLDQLKPYLEMESRDVSQWTGDLGQCIFRREYGPVGALLEKYISEK